MRQVEIVVRNLLWERDCSRRSDCEGRVSKRRGITGSCVCTSVVVVRQRRFFSQPGVRIFAMYCRVIVL